jgi:hypothetical protein
MRTIFQACRALLGYRTYVAIDGCECPECTDENRIGLVPWKYRLNQPPFRN